ncbi:ABC transporter permease [Flavihumibacter petaseus]|uniref:Putative ABC transporter permease protein n=1 Tax=Flavihumibacter petaseus NBRC 106054 TaxID=1220578 RepID=A0A0E9N147_9BACT|nr:FtsX-like permease family protein [Flavihumibacter petaseus]GAO43463.1 putative ABC transporter permease protein [Flavihumibacter petaseus NBRC 106054]
MNIPRFIATRIALNRQKSFSRFIIRLAVAATAVSVTAMIIALSFTTGFQQAISQKIFSFWGHVRVKHYEPEKVNIAEELPITRNDTVEQLKKVIPGIQSIQAFATRNAILKTAESIEGVLFKGVDAAYDTSRMKAFLKEGRWMHFPDSGYSNEIVLSVYTANQLSLAVGKELLIYFIQSDGSPPRVRKLMISGLYKTGIEEYDKLIALGDLRLVQRMNNWPPDQIGGYEVFAKDFHDVPRLNEKIFDLLPPMWINRSIEEIYPNIFDWLNLQDKTILIVLIIMTIVAVLNLITCLIILVLERTRMIGVLKALGAYNIRIQQIFLYHGAVITLAGILIGDLLAFILIFLQKKYGIIRLPEEMYYIDKAEVVVVPWQILAVNVGTFLVCMAVLLIPTWIVRRVQPVKAMAWK